jgi:hypothetical protein
MAALGVRMRRQFVHVDQVLTERVDPEFPKSAAALCKLQGGELASGPWGGQLSGRRIARLIRGINPSYASQMTNPAIIVIFILHSYFRFLYGSGPADIGISDVVSDR